MRAAGFEEKPVVLVEPPGKRQSLQDKCKKALTFLIAMSRKDIRQVAATTRMKSKALAGLLALCRRALVLAIVSSPGIMAESILIHVVDGRNGHPIPDEKLQMWINSQRGSAFSLTTDRQGFTKVEIPLDATLLIFANLYVDCRYFKQTGPVRPAYVVSDILLSGVSAANACGKLKMTPTPGELIFFVRPEHWWEGMKR